MLLEPDRLTAIHEAGHCLTAHLLGLEVIRGFVGADPEGEIIDPDGMACGGTLFHHDDDWRKLLTVAAAGWTAEELLIPGIKADRGDDERFCHELLAREGFSAMQAGAIMERATEALAVLLQPHMGEVADIAYFLTESGQITGRDVAALALQSARSTR